MISGALVLLIGILIGWILRAKTHKPVPRALPPPPPRETICGCGHNLAMHDTEAMRCHAQVSLATTFWSGKPLSFKWEPCPCQQYIGPMPYIEFVAGELPVDGVGRIRKIEE